MHHFPSPSRPIRAYCLTFLPFLSVSSVSSSFARPFTLLKPSLKPQLAFRSSTQLSRSHQSHQSHQSHRPLAFFQSTQSNLFYPLNRPVGTKLGKRLFDAYGSKNQLNHCGPKVKYTQSHRASSFYSTTSMSSSSSSANNCATSQDKQIHQPSSSTTNPSSSLPLSQRTIQTLDPCVILMKQIISQHASKWQSDPHGIYSLAQGVVYWRPPQSAYDAISDALAESSEGSGEGSLIHTYCPDEGYPPLLSALKIKLEQENGIHDPHVIVTPGANQAFVNCALTLLDERDRCDDGGESSQISKCVVFEPYYFNHVMAVQMSRGGRNCGGTAGSAGSASAVANGSNVEGLLVGPTENGVPDLDWLRTQLEKYKHKGGEGNAIRMVTLVNPGNPTGVSLPYSFLKEVMQLTKEYGVWLVMDNTYEHFDVKRKNCLPSGPEYPCFDEEHVINIFSFSKGYAMAGFRVGYIALSSKCTKSPNNDEVGRGTIAYEQMLKVQDTIAICTSRISQLAALGALRAGRQWVYGKVETLETGREAILEAMSPLKEIIGGDGAMYVMGRLPGEMEDQEFASALVEHYGVAVIPGSFCGYPGWIRVCYSNLPPEDCKLAAARLKRGIVELIEKK